MADPIPVTEEILTPRCRLRHPEESDIPHVWSATRVAGFNDGMRWDPPETIEELQSPFQKNRSAWLAGTDYNWTIEDRQTRDFLGRVSIRREQAVGEWSIGFWVHPNHQGKGYAREAAAAMVSFGFERLAADRITAAHAIWNHASGKVLVGIGMTFVRVNPKGFMKRGGWVEEHEYEIQR